MAGAELTLRPFIEADETEARAAQDELARDDFTFLLEDYDPAQPWTGYLDRLARVSAGIDLAVDRVPASLLAADVGGELVGRTSIRHPLNDYLAQWGGHIGYGVRPAFRRRGYAKEILRQSLAIARSLQIESALVVCNADNAGSAAVIESCGGVLDSIVDGPDGGKPMRRYWVTTTEH